MKQKIGLFMSAAFGAIAGSSMARWLTTDHPLWIQIGWIAVCVVLGAVLAAFAYAPRESAKVCKEAYEKSAKWDWRKVMCFSVYSLIALTGFVLAITSFYKFEASILKIVRSCPPLPNMILGAAYIVSSIGGVVGVVTGVPFVILSSFYYRKHGSLNFFYAFVPFLLITPVSFVIFSIAITAGLIYICWKVIKNISIFLWAIASIVVISLYGLTKCPTRHAAMGGGAIGTLVGYFGKNPLLGGLVGGTVAVSLSLFATYAKQWIAVRYRLTRMYWRHARIA